MTNINLLEVAGGVRAFGDSVLQDVRNETITKGDAFDMFKTEKVFKEFKIEGLDFETFDNVAFPILKSIFELIEEV